MLRAAQIALAAFTLAACSTVQPYELTADQIRPYIEFVEKETGYKLAPLPAVVAASPDFQKRKNSDLLGLHEQSSAFFIPVALNRTPQGAYHGGLIVLDGSRFRFEDLRQQSVLVHELVHHGQFLALYNAALSGIQAVTNLVTEKGWVCPKSKEAEAYRIQNTWIAKNAPFLPQVSHTHIARMSSCDDFDTTNDKGKTEAEKRAFRMLEYIRTAPDYPSTAANSPR